MALKPTRYLDSWKHGFIRVDRKGRKIYVIRSRRDGRSIDISTGAHTETAAQEEYDRWAADPDNYQRGSIGPSDDPAKKPVELTAELVAEFLKWSKERGKHERGNSPGHVANQRIAMDFWVKHLGGKNLKKLDMQKDILPPLKNATQQANRRRTLRTFYSWLRSEDGGYRIKLSEDPTFKSFKVPKSDPRRRKKKNKAVAWEHLLAVKEALDKAQEEAAERTVKGTFNTTQRAPWASVFTVQMATGWHETELAKFAADGRIETYTGPMKSAKAVLVCPEHKIGGEFRTAVDTEVLEAAKQLLEYGSFAPANYSKAVKKVAIEVAEKQAKDEVPVEKRLEPFTAGQLRASVATHMINNGATVYEVATFLNHKSLETTKKFYATHAIPWNPLLGVNPTRITGAVA